MKEGLGLVGGGRGLDKAGGARGQTTHQNMGTCCFMYECMCHTASHKQRSSHQHRTSHGPVCSTAMTEGHVMAAPDKVCHISNVHAYTEVPSRQGLNRQGVVQITRCGGVYAEQPAATPTFAV